MGRSLMSADAVRFYSHPATRADEWVVKKTGGRRGGFFVESGAYDGIEHSDTLALEKHFGWCGLLIEADPTLMEKLGHNRPDCLHRAACLHGDPGYAGYFLHGGKWGGLVREMPSSWLDEHDDRGTASSLFATNSLQDVLRSEACCQHIDYLSLDLEGAEYSVLKSWFDSNPDIKIDLLSVEYQLEQGRLERLEDLLGRNGYELDEVRGFDACFVRKGM